MSLSVIGTPIGNLGDLTVRASDTLAAADLILAEDTRRTRKLLSHCGITGISLESMHEHTDTEKIERLASQVAGGKNTALVTDSGTPAVSDPAAALVRRVRDKGGTVTVVPGPSAVTAAISIAAVRADTFCFRGYPPKKKGRKEWFACVVSSPEAQVLFSTPHHITDDMYSLKEEGIAEGRYVFVARELTKQYESMYWGNIDAVIEQVDEAPHKGEFTIVIAPA